MEININIAINIFNLIYKNIVMDEFLRNELRLSECYRGYDNKEEAAEKCQKYADEMKRLVNEENILDIKNALKEKWISFYKTKKYYSP